MGNPAGENRKKRLKRKKKQEQREMNKLLHSFFGYPPVKGCKLCKEGVYHGSSVSPASVGTKVDPKAKGIPIAALNPLTSSSSSSSSSCQCSPDELPDHIS